MVPVGGGGLISGIAVAAKALKPEIRVFGVESSTYPSMHQRLDGLPVEVGGDTIAEGIAVKDVGDIALRHHAASWSRRCWWSRRRPSSAPWWR